MSQDTVDYYDSETEQQQAPDFSEMSAGDLFPQQKTHVPLQPLDSMQLIELHRLVEVKSHPEKIGLYLISIGYNEDQIESLLNEHDLRRHHLLQMYRGKVLAKVFGALLIIVGIAACFADLIYVGLIGLGIALLFFI